MEIKFQIKGRVFSIQIGHKTKWFSSSPWITIIEEFYDYGIAGGVTYAKMIWSKY